MSDCVIKIEHLKKVYPNITPLKDVNVEINKGDVISIIGPSGTGKSTLLRCINRLEQPTEGKIIVLGETITDKSRSLNLVRQKMGMVFQSFNLFNNLTVLENIMAAPMHLKKKSRLEAEVKARELLRKVGLSAKADSFPSELSGGQKQRVAIARALAMNPEILLFDEPTSALDPNMVQEVQFLIERLALTGITMLIVTHEMHFARGISNRVFYMDEGVIYEDGTPEQIFEHPTKEKTKTFIERFKIFTLNYNVNSFDMDDALIRFGHFVANNRLSPILKEKLHALFEEVVAINILEKNPEVENIEMKLKALEDLGKVEVSISFKYKQFNPLDQADEISIKIINSIAEFIYNYEYGVNMIRGVIDI